jgi:hypothetical protein
MGDLMRTNSIRMFGFAALMGLLGIAHAENADEVVMSTAPEDLPSLASTVGPQGFVTQLPAVDNIALVEQLNELRSSLILHKQELASELEEKKFDTGDAVLALVMPGGLLYAGYKKAAYARASQNLDDVSENIAEYSSDLAMLQAQLPLVAVAQLK